MSPHAVEQKREENQVFLLSFESLIFPFRRLRIFLRKMLPAIPFVLAYDGVDVMAIVRCYFRVCEPKDKVHFLPNANLFFLKYALDNF